MLSFPEQFITQGRTKMLRLPVRLLLLGFLFLAIFGCGGGSSTGNNAPRIATVRVAVNSPTPLESLQFTLVNVGSASYIVNSATVSGNPSGNPPGTSAVDATQSGNITSIALIALPGIPNPVIELRFEVTGNAGFTVGPSGISATGAEGPVPLSEAAFMVTVR
jgi:hypothetical protein